MTKQASLSPSVSLPKRFLRALISLIAILCFILETIPVYADDNSVRVRLLDADRFTSIRLTGESSECLQLLTTHNLIDDSPRWWIDVKPNTTLTPILYTRTGCEGTSRRTDPSSVNVGTMGTTLQVKICNEEGQPTSLPNFVSLEDGMCFTYNDYIHANRVAYPASRGTGLEFGHAY